MRRGARASTTGGARRGARLLSLQLLHYYALDYATTLRARTSLRVAELGAFDRRLLGRRRGHAAQCQRSRRRKHRRRQRRRRPPSIPVPFAQMTEAPLSAEEKLQLVSALSSSDPAEAVAALNRILEEGLDNAESE